MYDSKKAKEKSLKGRRTEYTLKMKAFELKWCLFAMLKSENELMKFSYVQHLCLIIIHWIAFYFPPIQKSCQLN